MGIYQDSLPDAAVSWISREAESEPMDNGILQTSHYWRLLAGAAGKYMHLAGTGLSKRHRINFTI
jgi:hypothetical protein